MRSLHLAHNQDGLLTATLAFHEDGYTTAVHEVENSFHFAVDHMGTQAPDGDDWSASLSKDRKHLSLTGTGSQPFSMQLTSAQVDVLILRLGYFRSHMAEQVPRKLAEATLTSGVNDPLGIMERTPHPSIGGVHLALRHGGFGWMSFFIPDDKAQAMGQWLVEHGSGPDNK